MEKTKLIEQRKVKGLSQNAVAEKLCMDVSNYNRREKGIVKISLIEWGKLSDILDVSIEDIFESDENQMFICRDSSTVHYQGTNNIYSIPEYLLETQSKYILELETQIQKLTSEIVRLKDALANYKAAN